MPKYTPVKPEEHKSLKVAERRGLEHIAEQHLIGTTAKEYSQLAINYPLFFIKENDNFRSVALLGLQSGQNLYYKNETMDVTTLPLSASISPFALGLDPEKENTLTTCIDLDSKYVGEDQQLPLFDAEGKETDLFKSVQDSLAQLYQNEVMTEKYIKELVALDLLQEFELLINLASGENKRLVGLYNIDEAKLAALTDEQAADFHKRGLFIPLHSMMISKGQIHRLVNLNNDNNDVKVKGIKLQPRNDG